jgi:hypothetical protein
MGKTRFLIELHGGWVDPQGQNSVDDVYAFMESFGYYPRNFFGKALFAKQKAPGSARAWLGTSWMAIISTSRRLWGKLRALAGG